MTIGISYSCICVMSGGMDSTLVLHQTVTDPLCLKVLGVFFDYGQVNLNDKTKVEQLAKYYGIKVRYVKLPAGLMGHTTALTNPKIALPQYDSEEEITKRQIASLEGDVVVPLRNAVFLAHAVLIAQKYRYEYIRYGAWGEWDFPDGTIGMQYYDVGPEFAGAMAASAYAGCDNPHPVIEAPLIWYRKKTEILRQCIDQGVPLHLTTTCYKSGELACGKCEACMNRLWAFKELGYDDPIPYEVQNG